MTYELITIFEAVDESIVNAEISELANKLQCFSDKKLVFVNNIGRKSLAYEVHDHIEGHYAVFNFEAPSYENIASLEQELRRNKNVLKFLVLNNEETELKDFTPASNKSEQKKPIDIFNLIFGIKEGDDTNGVQEWRVSKNY